MRQFPFHDVSFPIPLQNNGYVSTVNVSLNATATWHAHSFYVKNATTLQNVRLVLQNTNTIAIGDVRVDIYSDTGAGVPNASLANTTNAVAVTALAFYDFTFNVALSAATQYWIVVRNLNASPATNILTWRAMGNAVGVVHSTIQSTTPFYGFGRRNSTDGGATWTTVSASSCGPLFRLDFSDGTSAGCPVSNSATDTTNTVFSTREVGMVFTTPQNVRLAVSGVYCTPGIAGTPTGDLRYRIYKGTTLVATTTAIPKATVTNLTSIAGQVAGFFTSPVILDPNTVYRVTMGETTQSDTSTNNYRMLQMAAWDNNATSLALKPWNGTASLTYFNGSTWTDTASSYCPMNLLMDFDTMFYPVGYSRGRVRA